MKSANRWLAVCAAIYSLVLSPIAQCATVSRDLPAGSKVFLTLDEGVTSKRGESAVGQVVRCRVWRDVDTGGMPFIKAGTPATCKIDKVKRRNMGGIEGKISIAGIDTTSVDGQSVMLSGGYNKEGSGRKAVVWTVGLLLLWPVLFVPGGAAELPPGTIFDTYTASALRIASDVSTPAPAINLSGVLSDYSAEFMLDEFLNSKKPEVFKIKITKTGALPSEFMIDTVNDKPIEPLPLKVTEQSVADDTTTAVGEVEIKKLGKHFQKGINRFDVAYKDGQERIGTEVLVEIQM
jgi:hypothetical protein